MNTGGSLLVPRSVPLVFFFFFFSPPSPLPLLLPMSMTGKSDIAKVHDHHASSHYASGPLFEQVFSGDGYLETMLPGRKITISGSFGLDWPMGALKSITLRLPRQ